MRRFFKVRGLSRGNAAKKLLWLSLSLALISGTLAIVTQLFAEGLFGWSGTVHREYIELTPNRYISVSSADMPLEVYVHDGGMVIVEYIGETELFILEDELELKIGRVEDFTLSLFSRDRFNYKMRVGLPGNYYEYYKEIYLTSASGNISAEGLKTEILIITSRNGDITVRGIEGEIIADTRFGVLEVE